MSEEYLDIVDENGKLTGERELRSVCHAKGLWHRTVRIYLFRKRDDEVELIIHSFLIKRKANPNMWTASFGGHIKSGSTAEESIITELKEEINLNPEIRNLIKGFDTRFCISYDSIVNHEYTSIFYLPYDDDIEKLIFNDDEIQQVKWSSLEQIEKAIINNPTRWYIKTADLLLIKSDLLEKISA